MKPQNDDYLEALATSEKLVNGGSVEEGIKVWTRFVENHPTNAEGYFNRGVLLNLTCADPLESVVCFQNACRIKPDISTYHLELASALQSAGKYVESISACCEAIKLAPDEFDAYQRRGMAYYYVQKYELSQEDFAKVLQLDSENGFVILRRSINFLELGMLDESLSALQNYLSIRDRYASDAEGLESLNRISSNAHIELAGRFIDDGKLIDAERVLDQLIRAGSTLEDFDLVFMMSDHYLGIDKAMDYFRQIVVSKIIPSSDSAFALSTRASAIGRHDDAIFILEYATSNHPDNLKCTLELGCQYLANAALDQAEVYFRRAAEIDESDAESHALLAWVLSSDTQQPAQKWEALEIAQQLLASERFPQHKRLKVLARCQVGVGMLDEARQTIEHIKSIAPDEDLTSVLAYLADKGDSKLC